MHQVKLGKDCSRNSGGLAVVEGCGSNGCEYMTGGAIILGKVGDNFGAGMTGGMAFVYDPKDNFQDYANPQSIIWQAVETDYWKDFLKNILQEFYNETGSEVSKKIINNFDKEINYVKQVCPVEMLDKLDNPISFKNKVFKSA